MKAISLYRTHILNFNQKCSMYIAKTNPRKIIITDIRGNCNTRQWLTGHIPNTIKPKGGRLVCKQTLWLAPAPPISEQNPQWWNHAFQSSSTWHYLKTITKTTVVDNFKDIFRWQCGSFALSSFMSIVQLSIYVIFVFCLWHPSIQEWQWCKLTRFKCWWIRHYRMMSVLPLIMIFLSRVRRFDNDFMSDTAIRHEWSKAVCTVSISVI